MNIAIIQKPIQHNSLKKHKEENGARGELYWIN
jgi:hypothetical protein